MGKYAKAVVGILGAAITAALGLGLSGTIQQVLTVAAAVVTAAGVYLVPNSGTSPVKPAA
jgi:hypothetical protein